jgi:hypothetical protein
VKRAAVAFYQFWHEFLIGDTPEFAVVTLAVVGLAFVLRTHRDVGIIVLPCVTLASVATSAWFVRRK